MNMLVLLMGQLIALWVWPSHALLNGKSSARPVDILIDETEKFQSVAISVIITLDDDVLRLNDDGLMSTFLSAHENEQPPEWRAEGAACCRLLPARRLSAECRPTGVNFLSSCRWNPREDNSFAEPPSLTTAGWPQPPTVLAGTLSLHYILYQNPRSILRYKIFVV